jgi:hypothetical protein
MISEPQIQNQELTYVLSSYVNVVGRLKAKCMDWGHTVLLGSRIQSKAVSRHNFADVVPPSATSFNFNLPSIYCGMVKPISRNRRTAQHTLTSTLVTPSDFESSTVPSTRP